MSFQENLKYYREKAGYKQAKDFYKLLGVPYSTYIGYESKGREPKYQTLCKIADLLNVSTDQLLGRENNILGGGENERLQKELSDVINYMKEKKCPLDLNFDIKEDIKIYIKDKDILLSMNYTKDDIAKMINRFNAEYNEAKRYEMYSYFCFDILDNAKSDLNKLSDSQTLQITKIYRMYIELLIFFTETYKYVAVFKRCYNRWEEQINEIMRKFSL